MTTLAITGGTGFVGSHLLDLALSRGYHVRALTRRPRPDRPGVTWIEGALDRPESLIHLCRGADAVIHVAGVISGSDEQFHQGNVVGTENMVDAAARTGIERFVYVSSLAAREPALSTYGRSKCVSEESVIASGGEWTIIRPPAIYGPGDRELLELFRLAARGIVPLPPGGALSVIAVQDLCRLLLACLDQPISFARTFEPDDGKSGGWSTIELARAIGRALGRRIVPLPLPRQLLLGASWIGRQVGGPFAKLTRDRVAYFCHPDWTAAPHAHPPKAMWQAEIDTEAGLAETARWYRTQGWLH